MDMSTQLLGFTAVPAIVIIAYFVGFFFKTVVTTNAVNKYIPVICPSVGMVLGIIAYFFTPNIMPAEDPISAAAIGIVSGLAATGVNQMIRQFTKTDQ